MKRKHFLHDPPDKEVQDIGIETAVKAINDLAKVMTTGFNNIAATNNQILLNVNKKQHDKPVNTEATTNEDLTEATKAE